MKDRYLFLVIAAAAVALFLGGIYGLWYNKKYKKEITERAKKARTAPRGQVGLLDRLAESALVNNFKKFDSTKLRKIFYRAKNPWNITVPVFQFIRFFGLGFMLAVAAVVLFFSKEVAIFCAAIGILFVWYPMYYYKAIGEEREAEWNKMYEFIWVLKHNAMQYDPARVFLKTSEYIAEHAPHDKEIIQGFKDFYQHWDDEEIPEYIQKFYDFPVPKEIYQIIFNMYKSGTFPEDSINSLREFIINKQDLVVEKALSGVSGKATIYSLPFMMLSVIVALMVPMVFQLLQFL